MSTSCEQRTLGQHLATRLSQIGIKEFFGVPGDYNLALLDELVKEKDLKPIWCCNELNAGYAADGAARIRGVGCLVVTFTVGGLSAINAVAGAYAENLPVICITGGPNSNDYVGSKIIHHTIGDDGGFMQELECFKHVTCEQVVIKDLETAHELIDRAISAAIRNSKPVYISVACNLASLPHPTFSKAPVPYALTPKLSNEASMEAAVSAAAEFLNSKTKPVLVAGPLLHQRNSSGSSGTCSTISAFMELVEASGYPFAYLSAAKGLLPEDHPACMGTYWGVVSSPVCQEVVESADAYLFVGSFLNDYASVGGTLVISDTKMIKVDPYRVSIAGGQGGNVFGCVRMEDFLLKLAKKIQKNHHALEIYNRMVVPLPEIPSPPPNSPLLTKILYKHIQEQLLTSNSILLAETGDAVFNCQKMKLPRGCQYHWSQQYGSIGWSVGATLGLAAAAASRSRGDSSEEKEADKSFEIGEIVVDKENGGEEEEEEEEEEKEEVPATTTTANDNATNNPKRVVACIGDGSFQMTCQEVSTMLRYHLKPVIILINNGSYTIEVQIHDGPYNVLHNWDYVGLVHALNNHKVKYISDSNGNGNGGGSGGTGGTSSVFAVRVTTEEELVAAIRETNEKYSDSLCFIEAVVHKDDCSRELLEWGSLVSRSNSRPPRNI
jgi:pyruvate decarboxylase